MILCLVIGKSQETEKESNLRKEVTGEDGVFQTAVEKARIEEGRLPVGNADTFLNLLVA